jgi:hypothetical protein
MKVKKTVVHLLEPRPLRNPDLSKNFLSIFEIKKFGDEMVKRL